MSSSIAVQHDLSSVEAEVQQQLSSSLPANTVQYAWNKGSAGITVDGVLASVQSLGSVTSSDPGTRAAACLSVTDNSSIRVCTRVGTPRHADTSCCVCTRTAESEIIVAPAAPTVVPESKAPSGTLYVQHLSLNCVI